MHRPDHVTAKANFDGLGHNGYQGRNPTLGIPATIVTVDQGNEFSEGLSRLCEEAGLTLVKGDYNQIKDAVRLLGGQTLGLDVKNLFINGSFRFWQRWQSVTLNGAIDITASRWKVHTGTGGVGTISKQTFAPGAAPHVSLGESYLQWAQTTGGTGVRMEQRLESMEELDGQNLTEGFWLRVTSGTLSLTPRLAQDFGAGGSATVVVTGTPITVTTTWTRFKNVFAVPSISGKTLGAGRFTALGFTAPDGATFTLQVAGAQANLGSLDLPFQRVSDAIDYLRLSRFEWKTYAVDVDPSTVTTVGCLCGDDTGVQCESMNTPFPVPMRTTPAITYFAPHTGAVGSIERPIGSASVVNSTSFNSEKQTGAAVTAVSSGIYRAHAFYDAEL